MGKRTMLFWLGAESVAGRLRAPRRLCMWLLMRAAAAVHYEPLDRKPNQDQEPF